MFLWLKGARCLFSGGAAEGGQVSKEEEGPLREASVCERRPLSVAQFPSEVSSVRRTAEAAAAPGGHGLCKAAPPLCHASTSVLKFGKAEAHPGGR